MNIEDIKAGETYNVRVKVSRINAAGVFCYACDKDGTYFGKHTNLFTEDEVEAFTPVTPAPKYDTCRLFRKGDKVRVVEWNGRKYYDYDHHTELKTGCIAEIWENEKDEQEEGFVSVMFEEHIRCVPPCYLELITPVEEIEPWVIDEGDPHFWGIVKIAGKFPVMLPRDYYTREQAEAEVDRLNAEYRKEQK